MASVLLTKIPHHYGIYYKLTEFRVTHITRYKNSFFLVGLTVSKLYGIMKYPVLN